MDFNHSDMQRMLLDSAERYLGDRFTLEHRRAARNDARGLDAEAWAAFAELGWLALTIPEAQGGLGASIEDMAVLSTALGARLVVEPFASTAVLAAHVYTQGDGDHGAALARIAAGELRVALAHDEPGERYEYAAPRATRLARQGNRLILTGQKILAIDAPSAGAYLVTATIEGEAGMAIVAVDAQADGLTAATYPLLDGSRAADIAFECVSLEADAVIVPPARGGAVLAEAIDRATISLLAQAVGSMESCLSICSAYIKERHQFGQAIGKFQSLQHIMADMFVATHQARSALYMALAAIDAEPAARQRAISLASISVKEASQLVSRQGLQLHGGYGMTDEYEISHHYRRLMLIEKLYGDVDFHVRRVAGS
jgi:alkylation response protein AidB-like acyl-CoA dehydrogenase